MGYIGLLINSGERAWFEKNNLTLFLCCGGWMN